MAKLKRFSKKELLENKDKYKIRSYDHYMLNAGYKVVENGKIIGYINFKQFFNLNTGILSDNYGYREYEIL